MDGLPDITTVECSSATLPQDSKLFSLVLMETTPNFKKNANNRPMQQRKKRSTQKNTDSIPTKSKTDLGLIFGKMDFKKQNLVIFP